MFLLYSRFHQKGIISHKATPSCQLDDGDIGEALLVLEQAAAECMHA